MKVNSYKILFRLSASHSYFEQERNGCIQFLPGKVTKELQKRFGVKIRKGVNGLEVYTNNTRSYENFFSYITNVTNQNHFDFDIITHPQLFLSVTELPVKWLGQFIYDSRLSIPKEGGEVLVLEPVQDNEACLENLGSVSIRFDDIIKYSQKELSFNIEFKARATQWNYYIINRSKIKLDNPSISEKNNAISFDGPETVLTPDGISAIKFSSGTNLLALSEIPKYKFDLIDKVKGNISSIRSIFKGLPTPDPIRTTIVQVNGKNEFASPMYIYI